MRNGIPGGIARCVCMCEPCSLGGRSCRAGEVEAENAPSGAGLSRTQVGSGAVYCLTEVGVSGYLGPSLLPCGPALALLVPRGLWLVGMTQEAEELGAQPPHRVRPHLAAGSSLW